MRCPKCRSEVGNQSVCPYCGGTVYIHGSLWRPEDYDRQTTVHMNEMRGRSRNSIDLREIDRKIRVLETKMNLILILQLGIFTLTVLGLIIQALR